MSVHPTSPRALLISAVETLEQLKRKPSQTKYDSTLQRSNASTFQRIPVSHVELAPATVHPQSAERRYYTRSPREDCPPQTRIQRQHYELSASHHPRPPERTRRGIPPARHLGGRRAGGAHFPGARRGGAAGPPGDGSDVSGSRRRHQPHP